LRKNDLAGSDREVATHLVDAAGDLLRSAAVVGQVVEVGLHAVGQRLPVGLDRALEHSWIGRGKVGGGQGIQQGLGGEGRLPAVDLVQVGVVDQRRCRFVQQQVPLTHPPEVGVVGPGRIGESLVTSGFGRPVDGSAHRSGREGHRSAQRLLVVLGGPLEDLRRMQRPERAEPGQRGDQRDLIQVAEHASVEFVRRVEDALGDAIANLTVNRVPGPGVFQCGVRGCQR